MTSWSYRMFVIAICAAKLLSTATNAGAYPRQPITISPRGIAVEGQLRVINVRDYGAIGDGLANDTVAFRNAMDEVPAEGGIVYVPPGTYRVRADEICIRSNTWLLGAGEGSRIVRIANTNAGVFSARGATSIRVSHLAFDLAHEDGFETMLEFLPTNDPGPCGDGVPEGVACSGICVENCRFYTSSELRDDITLHAVLSRGTTDIRLEGNRIDGLQFKLAGPSSGHPVERVVVTNNTFTRPRNVAIALVTGTNQHDIRDVLISDNIISGSFAEGAIYVGTDGSDNLMGTCERVNINGNVIAGDASRARATTYIRVRPGTRTEQIVISGNTIDCLNRASNSKGIELLAGTDEAGPVRDLVIANNTIRGCDLAGIRVWAGIERASITGNSLYDTRGLHVIASSSGASSLLIDGNVIAGKLFGINIVANSPITTCLIRGNVILDIRASTPSDNVAGMSLVSNGPVLSGEVQGNIVRGTEPLDELAQDHAITELGEGRFDVRYLDNDVRGARADAFRINPCAVVRGNLGWKTESSGVTTIAPGATSVVIPHGLDVIPTLGQVVLTAGFGGASTGSPGVVWVRSIDATHLVVTCDAPALIPRQIGWHVMPHPTPCP